MKGKNTIALVSVVGIVFLMSKFVSSSVPSTQVFEEYKSEKLATICAQDDKVCYTCYSIPPNATSQNYIQLRRCLDNKETVIANYERYDRVDTVQLIDKLTIRLVLEDTTAYIKSKDTILVKVK